MQQEARPTDTVQNQHTPQFTERSLGKKTSSNKRDKQKCSHDPRFEYTFDRKVQWLTFSHFFSLLLLLLWYNRRQKFCGNGQIETISMWVCVCVWALYIFTSANNFNISMRLVDKLYVSAFVCIWISCNLPSFPLCAHNSVLLRSSFTPTIRADYVVFSECCATNKLFFFFFKFALLHVPHAYEAKERHRKMCVCVCRIDGWLESWAHFSFFLFTLLFLSLFSLYDERLCNI